MRLYEHKIFTALELTQILNPLRDRKRIVFTNGCFDLLHLGHIAYLQEAKKLGDILIVGVNSDDSVKRIKSESRPIKNQEQRSSILAALECVDYVVIFDEDTPLLTIQALMPDTLVKGGDYKITEIVGADEVIQRGGQVEIIDFKPGYSSSGIIDKIKRL